MMQKKAKYIMKSGAQKEMHEFSLHAECALMARAHATREYDKKRICASHTATREASAPRSAGE